MPQLTAAQRNQLRAQFRDRLDSDAFIEAVAEAVRGEPDTLAWHALNYRTAATQHAQAMFEALADWVRRNTEAQARDVRVGIEVYKNGHLVFRQLPQRVADGDNLIVHLSS